MFVNSQFQNYKYLVEPHDNFVILSTSKGIYGESGDLDSVPVYIQYFKPSHYGFESTYHSYDTFTFTDVSDSFSDDFLDRADSPFYFIVSFILCLFIVFIFNNLTKLFKKGGIFGFS